MGQGWQERERLKPKGSGLWKWTVPVLSRAFEGGSISAVSGVPFAGSSNSSAVGHWEDLWGEVREMGVSEAKKGKLMQESLSTGRAPFSGEPHTHLQPRRGSVRNLSKHEQGPPERDSKPHAWLLRGKTVLWSLWDRDRLILLAEGLLRILNCYPLQSLVRKQVVWRRSPVSESGENWLQKGSQQWKIYEDQRCFGHCAKNFT